MDTDKHPAEYQLAPGQFSRLTKRGILLGLSVPQLIALSVGTLTLVTALYTAGASGIVWTSPVWGSAALVAGIPIGGRKVVEWAPVGCRWMWRAAHDQLTYRRRIVRPRPVGTLSLPGDAAALREWNDPESGAVMIHDPHARTLTAVVAVSHPAFALLDPAEQYRRVVGWGRVLAGACRSGRISRVQVSERTLPDSGTGLADWWERHGIKDESWTATTYHDLIERAGPAGERHATTIALSLDLTAASRQVRTQGGGMRGAATVLRQEMTALTGALRAADLTVGGWLTADELAMILRTAYDPAVGVDLERHPDIGRSLATAGPVAVAESWDRLRTDSAFHAVLWISEWPRSQVFPGFLSPLVFTNGILRTVSLHYLPVRADQAARDLRKKKTELISDAHQRRRIGQIEDAGATAEYDDLLNQEADLTAGHGVLHTIGLVCVTAPTVDELDAAVSSIEQAAIQASCETRRLVGQQAQAFTAAALPLCRSV
ncbi:SCO6880 family protein [Cryobacterium zhongshanensis]|uniref:Type VII secretion protein EccE n=1 Tax=Cryobacterium zhongshanensis TaxID=2928153 RepID=A0AA41QYZ4_9MICO|nr:SCO6880 family protein [Cryobacterium zhongshanensis]MCI4658501.1 type VII secretion protein EccE [Cryobacterium zhongshanensis]